MQERTKSIPSRVIAAAFAVVMAAMLALAPIGAAFAASVPDIPDNLLENGGNVFGSSEDTTIAPPDTVIPHDFVWAGRNIDILSLKAGGDILAAGMNINVTNSQAGGSIRIAGMNIKLENSNAANNVTIAGQSIQIDDACELGGGFYAAGQAITFDGTATGGGIAGDRIIINGTIDGDILIVATTVELGPDAVITGTLRVTASQEPIIPSSANVGNVDYTYLENESGADAAAAAGAVLGVMSIISAVIGFLGTIVFAIVLVWLFRRPVEAASEMTRRHAGRIFATGAITAVAAPIAFALLCCFMVTMPIAFALLFSLVVLTLAAIPFAAASFARLVFPNMNRYGSAVIGAAVLGIASIIPILGVLVTIAAFIYAVGYVVQAIWTMRNPEVATAPAADAAYAAAAASVAPAPAPVPAPAPAPAPAVGEAATPAQEGEPVSIETGTVEVMLEPEEASGEEAPGN